MLETTREYAYDRLTEARETDAAAKGHCWYFASAAEQASNEIYEMPFRRDLWRTRQKANLENYRAAIDWGLSQGNDVQAGASIAADLGRFWLGSSPREGRVLLARAMTAINWEESPQLRARLAVQAAWTEADSGCRTVEVGDLERAVTVFADAKDRFRQIDALLSLGSFLGRSDHITAALPRFDEALALARSMSHMDLVAMVIVEMSGWLSISGDGERAKTLLIEAMAIMRRASDEPRLAPALSQMAEIRFAEGDIHGALENVREAIAIGRRSNFEVALVVILHNAAQYLLAAGDVSEATQCAQESLALAVRRETHFIVAHAIEVLAQVKARRGDLDCAARLVGYSSLMYKRQAVPRLFTEQFGYNRTMSILRAGLSEERLASLMAEGAALDETTAVAKAMLPPEKA